MEERERLINSRQSWPHSPRLSKHSHSVVFFVGRHMETAVAAASFHLKMISQVYKLGFEFLNLVSTAQRLIDSLFLS